MTTDIPDTIDGLVEGVRQGIVHVVRVGHPYSSQLLMWGVMRGLEVVAGMLLLSKAVVRLLVIVLGKPPLSKTPEFLIEVSGVFFSSNPDYKAFYLHFEKRHFFCSKRLPVSIVCPRSLDPIHIVSI